MNPIRTTLVLLSAALLAACTSTSFTQAVPKAEKESVKLVKSLVLDYDRSINVAGVFAQYGLCRPGTGSWEEFEEGRVVFSCYFDKGELMQWEWAVTGAGTPAARAQFHAFTFTSQADADYSGAMLLGPNAEDALKAVYFNRPPF